jgi:hypothetical protein
MQRAYQPDAGAVLLEQVREAMHNATVRHPHCVSRFAEVGADDFPGPALLRAQVEELALVGRQLRHGAP